MQSLILGNKPRIRNRQRGFGGLGLIDWWPKSLSDKIYLNVLRAEYVRQVGVQPSTKQDNKAGIRGNNKASTTG